jgi:hypothetical protein
MTEMQAAYDSTANVVSLSLGFAGQAERADQVHPRAIVALRDDHPIEVQLLYPDLGIDEPLQAVASRYKLDGEALVAVAQAAVDAPDRPVTLDPAAP